MNKTEKMKSILANNYQGPTPFSFWTHYPECDREPEKIAQVSYDLYKDFDLDFLKTMNNGMYAIEDYGAKVDFSEIETGGVAKVVETPINSYEDWANVPLLDLKTASILQRELDYLKRLLALTKGDVPVLMTVFSPITTADKLAGGQLKDHIQQDESGILLAAIQRIAQTTADLAKEAIELGADGIYLASQMSSTDKVSVTDYEKYGKPFDLQVIEAASDGWMNTVHIHGENIMFDLLKDYPLPIINWHIGETKPELLEGLKASGKIVMGGIERMDITANDREALKTQITRDIKDTQGLNKLLLTPGCVIRRPFDTETIRFIQGLL